MGGHPSAADERAMKGRLLIVVLGLCSVWLAASSGSDASTGTTVGVSENEWHITLGRVRAPHGKITFSVTNFGQDDHNFAIRKHGVHYGSTGRIAHGAHATLTVTLPPGTYVLLCSIPGHAALGMITHLTVT
jgi:uncharacterized cupredoxin-like copper-binding protein